MALGTRLQLHAAPRWPVVVLMRVNHRALLCGIRPTVQEVAKSSGVSHLSQERYDKAEVSA
jgi:hypothetical protein